MGNLVICLDNFDDYYDISVKRANVRPFLDDPNFSLINGSILDRKVLERCMMGADYVFHHAAQAGVRISVMSPMKSHEVNTTGTLMVLEAARKAGVRKVIYASSSSVYGKSKYLPLDEGHPTNPISPYAASKLCAENYCEIYRSIHGLDTVSLRYFTVFGPRMRPDLAISIFTRNALAGKGIHIFGDGSKSRDFTYIDNIVDANMRAMARGSGIYNIGGGRGVTICELAEAIVEMTGSSSKINYGKDAPGDMEHTLANITRAEQELDYRPKISIIEGLKKYIDHVRGGQRMTETRTIIARTS